MKNRYEALLVLRTQGSEENARDIIDRIAGDLKIEGASVEQIQKMDKRKFSYAAGDIDSGYYVNFVFEAEPALVDRLRAKFKLDAEIYRQHYQKLKPKKEKEAAA